MNAAKIGCGTAVLRVRTDISTLELIYRLGRDYVNRPIFMCSQKYYYAKHGGKTLQPPPPPQPAVQLSISRQKFIRQILLTKEDPHAIRRH